MSVDEEIEEERPSNTLDNKNNFIKNNEGENENLFMNFLRLLLLIGGTAIGLYGLYFGVPLLVKGATKGFEIFSKSKEGHIFNLLPGIIVIVSSSLVTIIAYLTQSKMANKQQTITKKKKQKTKVSVGIVNIITSLLFLLGAIGGVIYVLFSANN